MNHCGTQRLETKHLVLRRFTQNDASAMFKNRASDEEVTKFLMWQPHADIEVSKSVLRDWIYLYPDDKFYQRAIVLKDNGDEPIGGISVVHMDEKVATAHIGYCLGKYGGIKAL